MTFPVIAEQTFTSGKDRVSVLELYTSEGCSSCPPADRYVTELKEDERLWNKFIPVVFHVDYWDYIGWPDRFASASYSERQRNYARAKNVSTVYTPGFLLNGQEWRSFFGLRKLSLESEQAGNLKLTTNGKRFNGVYAPINSNNGGLILNVAILGFDIKTQVKGGENRDKTLHHDFTVLGITHKHMGKNENDYSASGNLPERSVLQVPRTAVVAWISEPGDQTPLQATGGWLKK